MFFNSPKKSEDAKDPQEDRLAMFDREGGRLTLAKVLERLRYANLRTADREAFVQEVFKQYQHDTESSRNRYITKEEAERVIEYLRNHDVMRFEDWEIQRIEEVFD